MDVHDFRTTDQAAQAAYRDDGVVCLRGAFGREWLDRARAGIERNLAAPGPFFRDHTRPGATGRYLFEFWSWPRIPELRRLVFDSPAGEIAGGLIGDRRPTMVMDNWFLREAGAIDAAPWHHDEPYFDFEGRLCILWLPLEPVARVDGLTFVRGSHRLGQLFAAAQFSENLAFECHGDAYAPMPDFANDPARWQLLSTDMDAGDCLVFDFRTVHAATRPGRALDRDSHRMTLRFAAEGTIFRPRGPWTREISDHLIAQGQQIGAPLDCPLMPRVWDSTSG